MAEAAHSDHYERGHMDIREHKGTFDGFIHATIWGCGLVAMSVALATLAFAIGAGWFPGLLAYVVIGIGVGVLFKQGGAWWATLIATTVLLAIGGAIVPAIAGMAG